MTEKACSGGRGRPFPLSNYPLKLLQVRRKVRSLHHDPSGTRGTGRRRAIHTDARFTDAGILRRWRHIKKIRRLVPLDGNELSSPVMIGAVEPRYPHRRRSDAL